VRSIRSIGSTSYSVHLMDAGPAAASSASIRAEEERPSPPPNPRSPRDADSHSRFNRADGINNASRGVRVSKGSLERAKRFDFLLTHLASHASERAWRTRQPSMQPLPHQVRRREREREIRTRRGLIKRYRNDNAVSRRSFGGTMGCIMAGMTRPFLSMATHRRRIVP